MTIRTIRARLLRLLQRERAAWLAHAREYSGCLSSCEDAQRWWKARSLLAEALRAAGARVPRWADPSYEEARCGAVCGSSGCRCHRELGHDGWHRCDHGCSWRSEPSKIGASR